MVTWGSSILGTLHICTYCIYIRDKYVLYILYSIYIWLYVCITNKYANAHIMHVADLNWQQSPPKAVLSSGASSKTDSVQFTFPFFCPAFNFSLNFAVGPVPLNLWLWPFGACWRLCMDHLPWRSGAQSVKRSLAQKQTRNSIFSGILKLISPTSCTAWFESFLS